MPRRPTPCPTPGCWHLVDPKTGDCDAGHKRAKRRQAQAATDARRPPPRHRGYDHTHATRFRAPVLRRDPVCVLCKQAPSRHADHWPHTRRQLEAMGENPNDPKWGRGLCHPCHSTHTATTDGGFGNPTQTQRPHAE